ncbi:hypothetical protein M432DRAFT_670108 [Thermoascus aurantiacus ATCC 26904]
MRWQSLQLQLQLFLPARSVRSERRRREEGCGEEKESPGPEYPMALLCIGSLRNTSGYYRVLCTHHYIIDDLRGSSVLYLPTYLPTSLPWMDLQSLQTMCREREAEESRSSAIVFNPRHACCVGSGQSPTVIDQVPEDRIRGESDMQLEHSIHEVV